MYMKYVLLLFKFLRLASNWFLKFTQNLNIFFHQIYQVTIYQTEESDMDSFDDDPEISLAVSKFVAMK